MAPFPLPLVLEKQLSTAGIRFGFSPTLPGHLPQFYSVRETMRNNQRIFYALDTSSKTQDIFDTHDRLVKQFPLEIAEADGSLGYVASTYSHENHVIHDGMSRIGPRVVTFAPILKQKIFPLAEISKVLLELGSWGMGTPIEIEFAVRMSNKKDEPGDFGLLQMRPLVLNREIEELKIEVHDERQILCSSPWVLGHGIIDHIKDIIYVDYHTFDRAHSTTVAREVSWFNAKLISEKRAYLLIGVGRWGTLDPWLGIPVKWDQISGAHAIVGAVLRILWSAPRRARISFKTLPLLWSDILQSTHLKMRVGWIGIGF